MTTHDELCEKVFPDGHTPSSVSLGGHAQAWENGYKMAKERFKQALTSGLLCDGKELENAEKTGYDRGKREYANACERLLEQQTHLQGQLEEAKKENKIWAETSKIWADVGNQMSSLKLKLEEAEKALDDKEDGGFGHALVEAVAEISSLKAKLSGSCEGMTTESMMEAAARAYCSDKNKHKVLDADLLVDICEEIHAQMTGGKK